MANPVLVDTSVWVSHLRAANTELAALLQSEAVACHPFVIGELALCNLRNRASILSLLQDLPSADLVEHGEALAFIDTHALHGRGIGYVDIHLLASTVLSGMTLWTEDKRLAGIAKGLRVSYR